MMQLHERGERSKKKLKRQSLYENILTYFFSKIIIELFNSEISKLWKKIFERLFTFARNTSKSTYLFDERNIDIQTLLKVANFDTGEIHYVNEKVEKR